MRYLYLFGYNYIGSTVSTGDSGGGYLFLHPHYHLYYLRGIVSVKLFRKTSVTIFTDITGYMDWIQAVLEEIKKEENAKSNHRLSSRLWTHSSDFLKPLNWLIFQVVRDLLAPLRT